MNYQTYNTEHGWVISQDETWIPGVFETEQEAIESIATHEKELDEACRVIGQTSLTDKESEKAIRVMSEKKSKCDCDLGGIINLEPSKSFLDKYDEYEKWMKTEQ